MWIERNTLDTAATRGLLRDIQNIAEAQYAQMEAPMSTWFQSISLGLESIAYASKVNSNDVVHTRPLSR